MLLCRSGMADHHYLYKQFVRWSTLKSHLFGCAGVALKTLSPPLVCDWMVWQ